MIGMKENFAIKERETQRLYKIFGDLVKDGIKRNLILRSTIKT